MPNPLKGEVKLKLAGQGEFVIVMDMEALVEAETAYGKPLQQMMTDATQGFVGASRALLYGALRAKHPTITLREASQMFMDDPDAVSQALTEAVEAGFPAAQASAEGNAPRRRGATSGGSGAKSG